jgi:hypothetical protein
VPSVVFDVPKSEARVETAKMTTNMVQRPIIGMQLKILHLAGELIAHNIVLKEKSDYDVLVCRPLGEAAYKKASQSN